MAQAVTAAKSVLFLLDYYSSQFWGPKNAQKTHQSLHSYRAWWKC